MKVTAEAIRERLTDIDIALLPINGLHPAVFVQALQELNPDCPCHIFSPR